MFNFNWLLNSPENINKNHKYLFIHIPKNAGTSICNNLGIKNSSHYKLKHYLKHYKFIQKKNYFKFAFVRNPYDRFLSLYHYSRMKNSHYHSSINPEKAKFGKHQDYDLLRDASLQQCAIYLAEGKLDNNNFFPWAPQSDWLEDLNDKINTNFIGRYENLNEDFKIICNYLNISFQSLKNLNRSPNYLIDYRSKIDSYTQKIIEDYYLRDLENFGYTF